MFGRLITRQFIVYPGGWHVNSKHVWLGSCCGSEFGWRSFRLEPSWVLGVKLQVAGSSNAELMKSAFKHWISWAEHWLFLFQLNTSMYFNIFQQMCFTKCLAENLRGAMQWHMRSVTNSGTPLERWVPPALAPASPMSLPYNRIFDKGPGLAFKASAKAWKECGLQKNMEKTWKLDPLWRNVKQSPVQLRSIEPQAITAITS